MTTRTVRVAPSLVKAPTAVDLPSPPVAAQSDESAAPDWYVVALAMGGTMAVWLLSLLINRGDKVVVAPSTAAGLTIFAAFFVAAQGIERLLEPISDYLFPTEPDVATSLKDAEAAVDHAFAAYNDAARAGAQQADTQRLEALNKTAEEKLKLAANTKAQKDRRHGNRAVVFWAIATSIGILASASLKLYLLSRIGLAAPPRALEILATGLIIGAGTKPLHDLVSLIEAKKEQKKSS